MTSALIHFGVESLVYHVFQKAVDGGAIPCRCHESAFLLDLLIDVARELAAEPSVDFVGYYEHRLRIDGRG